MKKLVMSLVALAASTVIAAPAKAEFRELTIRLSSGVGEGHPVVTGVEAMNACLADKSGGALKVQAFLGGALGGDLQATQSLRTGTLEMVVTATSPLVGIAPVLGVFDLPFLIGTEAEADRLLDGKFGQMISDKLPEHDLVNLAYWENGFRNVANSKHQVASVDDLKGLKIRVMQNNIYLDTFTTLGTNAVPMAGGEVFSALETHAIDGHENTIPGIDASKMYEVQKYLSLTAHAYSPFLVLYSKPLFDKLNAEEQAAVKDCAQVGAKAQREASRTSAVTSLAHIKEEGMEVVTMTPEEIARMRETVAPVYENHKATIGADVIEAAKSELAQMRQ